MESCLSRLYKGADKMFAIGFYGSILAGMILYGNTISAMKNIRDNKDTELNLIVGCACTGFIFYSIVLIFSR